MVSVSGGRAPSDETRYSKLKIVTEYIEKHEEVGTLNNPGPYFRGKLRMSWGPLGSDMVYFGAFRDGLALSDDELLRFVRSTSEIVEGSQENLEFLARKLTSGFQGDAHVVLGTPIYVAPVDSL